MSTEKLTQPIAKSYAIITGSYNNIQVVWPYFDGSKNEQLKEIINEEFFDEIYPDLEMAKRQSMIYGKCKGLYLLGLAHAKDEIKSFTKEGKFNETVMFAINLNNLKITKNPYFSKNNIDKLLAKKMDTQCFPNESDSSFFNHKLKHKKEKGNKRKVKKKTCSIQ